MRMHALTWRAAGLDLSAAKAAVGLLHFDGGDVFIKRRLPVAN